MQNVVTVRFTDYPDVGIEDYYYYCPDKTGATIIISDSESGSVYKLYEHTDWDNLLETKTSTQTGDDVVFDQLLLENKRYVIEATTRYGCSNKTEFEVKKGYPAQSRFYIAQYDRFRDLSGSMYRTFPDR